MPKPRQSSARALETKRFEAAIQSPPVRKLIQENTGIDRIAAVVDSSPYRIRAWLKAREAVRERRGTGEVFWQRPAEVHRLKLLCDFAVAVLLAVLALAMGVTWIILGWAA